MCAADTARCLLARGVLGSGQVVARLGSVRLHPHQRHAVVRIERALQEAGGALLADSVGLGKTYVALAVARAFESVLVVAPAVLRGMWMESAERAAVRIRFVSTESLSRVTAVETTATLVIVDEAHHFRNPRTRRYTRMAQLSAAARVLLLTATPVHNRPADLSALLALFLGSAAESLTPYDISRCVIRREHFDTGLQLPALGRTRRVQIAASDTVARAILALPPPVPPRDGGEANGLVRLALLHMWMSSDAAAMRGIRRSLTIGAAMRACLMEGRAPSRGELRSWLAGDGTVQLGLTELLVEPVNASDPAALQALDEHIAALRALLQLIRAEGSRDACRASELRRLRSIHRSERMLAFSSYAATVHALYRELARDGKVATVTARGGRIASGSTTREEVLRMFRAPDHPREEVRLLLTTDLLSEGLNLPQASIVIHLDLPWTAARLEQRVGRARRPGTSTRVVRSYAFVQPSAIERLIGKEQLIARKARAAEDLVGAPVNGDTSPTGRKASPPRATEKARRILMRWGRGTGIPVRDGCIHVAAVRAEQTGFLALVMTGDGNTLIAGTERDVQRERTGARPECAPASSATTDPDRIHATLAMAGGASSPVEPRSYLAARRAIARWLVNESVHGASGAHSPPVPEVRALLCRLDAAAAAAPLHVRAGMSLRVSRIRERLAGRLTRGLEMRIAEYARNVTGDDRLIEVLETLVAGAGETPASVEGELLAVLLLENSVQLDRSANITSAARCS